MNLKKITKSKLQISNFTRTNPKAEKLGGYGVFRIMTPHLEEAILQSKKTGYTSIACLNLIIEKKVAKDHK